MFKILSYYPQQIRGGIKNKLASSKMRKLKADKLTSLQAEKLKS